MLMYMMLLQATTIVKSLPKYCPALTKAYRVSEGVSGQQGFSGHAVNLPSFSRLSACACTHSK